MLACSGAPAARLEPHPAAESPPHTEPASDVVDPPLQGHELTLRLASSIEQTRDLQVVYTDPLGEGPFHFDPDPLLPSDRIDCMTWLQWVLALAYAGPDGDPAPWLQALRYYRSTIGFDTRKHYVDRWIWLDPGPMRTIDCGTHCQSETIELETQRLIETRGAPCPLWRSDVSSVEIQSVPQAKLTEVVADLQPGFYVLFGVASERYLDLYGSSGPMAQVHPALLEVGLGEASVSHASTALDQVATVPLSEWMSAVQNLHRATTLYALDPAWWPAADKRFIDHEARCPHP